MRRVLALVAVLIALAPSMAHAQSAAQRLADKYAPILGFEPQKKPCGKGQPYRPTSVNIVLGRQGVVLRGPGGKVVKRAPTQRDLFGLGEDYNIDFPGDPLKPGCIYEKDFRAWSAGTKPLVYAHVATDAAHPGKLAVQYWFWYTFNDFSGKHEGDWELAQVDFDAPTAQAALGKAPYQVDLAQHAGGERADWKAPKLKKQGNHPVLYVSTGSHATYFGRRLYLGRGPSEGFGCDDTRKATLEVHQRVELLPETPDNADSPYAWLAFHGRWGQREKGFNDSPTGPSAKSVWSQPIEWADGLRDRSVTVPGYETLGPSVNHFFCGAVASGAVVYNWATVNPWPFFVLVGLLVVGSGEAARRTAWRPVQPEPIRMRRRIGQALRSAWRIYRADARTFLGMGLIFVPISVVAAAVQWVLFHLTAVENFVALDGRHGVVTALLALLIGGIGTAIASTCTTAAVAVALGELDKGRRILAPEAFRIALARWRALGGALVRQFLTVIVLTIVVVGIPFAIHRFIRWSLFAQAAALEDRDARGSLRRSSELVSGYWWRTFAITAFVDVLVFLSGPVIGVILLLVTDRSLNFIDITGSVIYAFTVPYAAVALTLYYFDLTLRERR